MVMSQLCVCVYMYMYMYIYVCLCVCLNFEVTIRTTYRNFEFIYNYQQNFTIFHRCFHL